MVKVCLAVVITLFAFGRRSSQSNSTPAAQTNQPRPAAPLIPDKFTNLQALPKEIEKADLLAIMKGFSMTFKVRCSHCHVATDDLSSADFPSDEKPTKQSARELLRKLADVQRKYPVGR